MRFKDYLLAGLAALSLAASSISSATTIEKEEFKDLVQNAHACVVARTVSIEHAMENGSPVTKTTFAVTETAFGTTPETITVTTPGGRLSNATVPMGEVMPGFRASSTAQQLRCCCKNVRQVNTRSRASTKAYSTCGLQPSALSSRCRLRKAASCRWNKP